MNRNTAIIATVATAVLCGCPGLFSCLFGAIFALGGMTGNATINDVPTDPTTALLYGVGSICFGIIFIAIPIAVGVLTLRNAKPA